MEWLLILALALWVFAQSRQLKELQDRVGKLERLRAVEPPESDLTTVPVYTPPAASVPQPAAATPVVIASGSEPELSPASTPEAPPRPERWRPPRKAVLAEWLSEHGLAWLGGGALMLGGLFLVTYAAQRGVFTPGLRIVTALAVGALMIGASEVVLRLERRWSSRQDAIAALLAGAGAATLYGAVWAADRLYGFIGLQVSAPALALISGGLLTLAFRHGFPLALLALAGAYLAPVVSDGPDWGDAVLAAYLLLILATGHATAALRRWGAVAWAASAGATLWALANQGQAQDAPTAALLIASPACALAAAAWRRGRDGGDWPVGLAADLLQKAPGAALGAAAIAATTLWLPEPVSLPAAAITLCVLALLAGAAAAARLVAPEVQAVSHAFATLAILPLLTTNGVATKLGLVPLAAGSTAAALALATGAGLAIWRSMDVRERLCASVGAVGAAFIAALVGVGLDRLNAPAPWLAPVLGAACLTALTALVGRRAPDSRSDLALPVWIWSLGCLAAQALIQGLRAEALPVGLAGLAFVFAVLKVRLEWRGFAAAALAASLAGLGALFVPLGQAVLVGQSPVWAMGLATAAAAALVWLAGRAVTRSDRAGDLAQGLSTTALAVLLSGAFLVLRAWSPGDGAPGLDRLTEAGLRSLLLLLAALVASRMGEQSGAIALWRGRALIWLGAAHAILFQVLFFNPLWSDIPLAGPPVLDSLLLAFLAPGVLLVFGALRVIPADRVGRDVAVALGLALALIWALLLLRRLFQGPEMWGAPDHLGRSEAAAYGLLLLLAAKALLHRFARGGGPRAQITRGAGWIFMGVAFLIFGWGASPWWGPLTRPMDGLADTLLLLALYGATAGAWFLLRGEDLIGRAAKAAAVLQGFAFVTLLLRFAFRGSDFARVVAEARVETWAFSALWALYGLAVMLLGARRQDPVLRWAGLGLLLFTTAKVFLFDMARLDGVVRAASFLAVGALLVAGALAARRLQAARAQ